MTSVSKNVYINIKDGIVSECNNAYQSTIKIKPSNVKSGMYIDLAVENMIKILNLKLVIMLEYHNTQIFLQNVTIQSSQEMFLRLIKLKALYHGHM